MNGGITIRKRKLLYEALLLSGMASCLFGLFLLFLLFNPDTNYFQKAEKEFVRISGFWQNQFFERNYQKVNYLTDNDQKDLQSNIDSTSKTSPNKMIDYQIVSSTGLGQSLSPLQMKDIDPNYIELMSIHSALQNYKEVKHHYPKSLHTLTLEYPNNYLSVIPEKTHYTLAGESYDLAYKGYHISSNQKEKIELHFYPSSNELVVTIADLPLARYAIASGKAPLPFKESKIEERVINPNGGAGPLGTRGFVLQDHYAIHGTNNPSSIGRYMTFGCIRLLNENIETLYSYIPIGTSFKVKTGNASSPVFSHGLPDFTGSNSLRDKVSIEKRTTNTPGNDSKEDEHLDKINSSSNNRICECNPNKTFQWRS